jgi:LuxR family maltose regulon positive regulatory protein
MVTPILTTKLHIPSLRRNLVPRQRLLGRMDQGLHRRLTLVSAPAGFGKTTLLGEWIRSHGGGNAPPLKVAWLSLDHGDNDPARFFAYLAAALGQGEEDLARARGSGLEFAGSRLQELHLVKLINQVAARPEAFALVLDDYHLITAQAIHDAVAFLIDHLPENLHLILATRADPPLPLPRLRARGHLTELRQSDLRFTTEESTAFLNNVMGLDLSAGDTAALEARTEGWIAGLQMASLAIQARLSQGEGQEPSHSARSEFVRALTGSHRFVLDYLVEEVLEQQPEEVQHFLLCTSILDRLCAPLCDSVIANLESRETGIAPDFPISRFPDSQAVLEHLEATNLFIIPLDPERRWYRYHRLFADLLRRRLGQGFPELVPTLHRRASAWYEQQGLAAEAIDHALAAGDLERAARLIDQAAEATLMRSEVTTLLRWLDALPDQCVQARPSLCIFQAWALLLAGRPVDAVEARLQDAAHSEAAAKTGPILALLALYRGQVSHAGELARQALQQLPEDDLFLHNLSVWIVGLSGLLAGDLATSSQALDQVARRSHRAGNVMIAVMVLCNVAELRMQQGWLHQARDVYQEALAWATDEGGDLLPIAAEALMGLGALFYQWNDLDAAKRHLVEGIELSGGWSNVAALEGYVSLAHVRQAQGDTAGAAEALQEAVQLARQFDATEIDDNLVAAQQAQLWVTHGNLAAAERWVEERALVVDDILAELKERAAGGGSRTRQHRTAEYFTLVRVLIAQERYDQALALLEPLLAIGERWGLKERLIRAQILRALALGARGDTAWAMEALTQALSLAEPAGYVRIFLDEGEPMARLLYQAVDKKILPEYVNRLLAAFPAPQPLARGPQAEMLEPLSERELEVLRLLAAGLSNPEIAEELVIAVSTVRSHCKNIYGKLDVHSRWDAVQRGQELGLI